MLNAARTLSLHALRRQLVWLDLRYTRSVQQRLLRPARRTTTTTLTAFATRYSSLRALEIPTRRPTLSVAIRRSTGPTTARSQRPLRKPLLNFVCSPVLVRSALALANTACSLFPHTRRIRINRKAEPNVFVLEFGVKSLDRWRCGRTSRGHRSHCRDSFFPNSPQ